MLVADDLFGVDLRLGIGPFGDDWLVLVDPFARLAWGVNEHGAREEELFDIEALERAKQVPSALDIDLAVSGAVLAGKVEIGGKVDNACEASAKSPRDDFDRNVDRPLVG